MRADYKRKNRAVRILLIVLVWMGLTHFVIGIAYIPTESMEPSIGNKSLIIEYRLPYIIPKYCRVERGDIISFTHEGFRNTMCKRVIGLPGEEISFRNGGCLYQWNSFGGELLSGRTFNFLQQNNNDSQRMHFLYGG